MKLTDLMGLAAIAGSAIAVASPALAQTTTDPSAAPANTGKTTEPAGVSAPRTTAGTAPDAPPPAPRGATGQPPTSVQEVVVTGRFISTGAQSATKLNLSVRDTPFSVAAYTNAFMKSLETTQVADLYRYMTGIQRAGNTGYDITFRGFQTSANDRNAILVDGLPGLTVRFGSPPTVGTDHLEVVRGPASVLYGQAQPGGFINIITKKPLPTQQGSIEVLGNQYIGRGLHGAGVNISVDVTGPIDSEKRFLYRLVAEVGSSTGFRSYSYDQPLFIAPSLTWNVDDATAVTLQYEHRRDQSHYDTYLVAPQKDIHFVAPIQTSYQEPYDFLRESGDSVTLLADHRFNQHLTFNFSYRGVDHTDTQHNFDVVAVTPDFLNVTRRARGQLNKRTYNFADTNLVGDFKTGPIGHKLIVGLDYGIETADLNRLQFFNGPTSGPQSLNISVLNPVYGRVLSVYDYPLVNPATPANLNDRKTTSTAFGAYASDLITFNPYLKAMVGVRYAKESQRISDGKLPNVPVQTSGANDVLPLAGVLVEPSRDLTFYASYTTSFVPTPASTQDINGAFTFKPTTAKGEEVGVKSLFFQGKLNATAAVFRITKENVLNSFNCPLGTCSNQLGAARSQGFEAEANLTPLRHWQILAGYSYTDARATSSNIIPQIGARLINVPYNSAHLWTRYDIADGSLAGLGFGVGLSYVGQRTGLLPTASSSALLLLPEYTVADMAVFYVMPRIDLTLKLSNLFDKRYYESAGFTGDINVLPGAPRSIVFGVRAHF